MASLSNDACCGSASALPRRAGVGFKTQHGTRLLAERPALGFLEIHAENYFGEGGPPHAQLSALREIYPFSIHGVGLSLGGIEPLDPDHLMALYHLLDRYEPDAFSEHLAWSTHAGVYFNDLLPIVYDREALDRVVAHVDQTQTILKRRLLLENPSTYVGFAQSEMDETEFIAEVARRTGCGLLLDVNNVMVSCVNHGRDPAAYLSAFPMRHVEELHLAGYAEDKDSLGARLLIDAHCAPVADDVWALFASVIRQVGVKPTLIEWDNDVPELDALLAQARRADEVMVRNALAAAS